MLKYLKIKSNKNKKTVINVDVICALLLLITIRNCCKIW